MYSASLPGTSPALSRYRVPEMESIPVGRIIWSIGFAAPEGSDTGDSRALFTGAEAGPSQLIITVVSFRRDHPALIMASLGPVSCGFHLF